MSWIVTHLVKKPGGNTLETTTIGFDSSEEVWGWMQAYKDKMGHLPAGLKVYRQVFDAEKNLHAKEGGAETQG